MKEKNKRQISKDRKHDFFFISFDCYTMIGMTEEIHELKMSPFKNVL